MSRVQQADELMKGKLGCSEVVDTVCDRLKTAQHEFDDAKSELDYATKLFDDLVLAIGIGSRWVQMTGNDLPPYPFIAKVERPPAPFERDTISLIQGQLDWYGFAGDGDLGSGVYFWGN